MPLYSIIMLTFHKILLIKNTSIWPLNENVKCQISVKKIIIYNLNYYYNVNIIFNLILCFFLLLF